MPKNVVHYLNMKMPDILVEIIELQLLVHSNEMSCRKRGRLGLDPVIDSCLLLTSLSYSVIFIHYDLFLVHTIIGDSSPLSNQSRKGKTGIFYVASIIAFSVLLELL